MFKYVSPYSLIRHYLITTSSTTTAIRLSRLEDSSGSSNDESSEARGQTSRTGVGILALSRGGGGRGGSRVEVVQARVQDAVTIGVQDRLQSGLISRERRHDGGTARAAFFPDEILTVLHSRGSRHVSTGDATTVLGHDVRRAVHDLGAQASHAGVVLEDVVGS